jgi:hypothetical protein
LQIPAKNKHLHGHILQFSCQKLNNNGIKENNSPLSFDVLFREGPKDGDVKIKNLGDRHIFIFF